MCAVYRGPEAEAAAAASTYNTNLHASHGLSRGRSYSSIMHVATAHRRPGGVLRLCPRVAELAVVTFKLRLEGFYLPGAEALSTERPAYHSEQCHCQRHVASHCVFRQA